MEKGQSLLNHFDALVIAGCLSGERDDAGVARLVDELTSAVRADVTIRARTGGRPVGPTVPEVLAELRSAGVRRALVATTHVADGRLQGECAAAVLAASPGFDELRLAPPLLSSEGDFEAVASALDGALPARPGRVVALAGHRGAECEASFARLEAALCRSGRADVLVGAPSSLAGRLSTRPGDTVLLGPLLMSLGHHARRDVLVDLSVELGRAGCVVERWPHALAELPAVRALVVQHDRRELP